VASRSQSCRNDRNYHLLAQSFAESCQWSPGYKLDRIGYLQSLESGLQTSLSAGYDHKDVPNVGQDKQLQAQI
jgi:hypothetical protein